MPFPATAAVVTGRDGPIAGVSGVAGTAGPLEWYAVGGATDDPGANDQPPPRSEPAVDSDARSTADDARRTDVILDNVFAAVCGRGTPSGPTPPSSTSGASLIGATNGARTCTCTHTYTCAVTRGGVSACGLCANNSM